MSAAVHFLPLHLDRLLPRRRPGPRPLVIAGVEPSGESRPTRLLVPLDGTRDGEAALPLAARWAASTGVPLHLVSVVHPDAAARASAAGAAPGDLHESAYVTSVARRLRAQGYRASTEVLHGRRAARAIRAEAAAVPGTVVVTAGRRRWWAA